MGKPFNISFGTRQTVRLTVKHCKALFSVALFLTVKYLVFPMAEDLIKDKKREEIERQLYSKLGKLGGPARAKSLTAAERKKIARNASRARWKKAKENTAVAKKQ